MQLHASVVHSFSLLSSTRLYEYITISLSIHLLMDVSVVSGFYPL